MFLVLAASRGWFGPLARVIAGGLLGLALVGIGLWLHRRPGGPTGALAVVGTGVAALYLDLAAATALYEFLPVGAGLALALAVAAGGLAIADRWSAELLACGAVLGAAALAPAITQAATPLLVGLVLALQLAAAPVVWRRGWVWLAIVAAVWPVLYGTLSATPWRPDAPAVVAALVVLVVGTGVAVLAARKLPAAVTAGLLVAAPVPSLVHALLFETWQGALIAGGAGALMLSSLLVHRVPRHARLAATAAGAVAVFEATAIAADGATLDGVLLGQAVVLTVLAAVTARRLPLVVAIGYGGVGLVSALVRHAPLAALVDFPQWPYVADGQPQTQAMLTGLVLSTLVLAASAAFLSAAARVGWIRPDSQSAAVWGPVSAIALYGAAGMVITTALLISPDETGFRAGHAVVTVSWTLAALVLLARGIRRPALRIAGMALVVTAVAKLVLFDLVALDGLSRVGAFLGAGLVLLAAGARYARMVAQAREADDAAANPGADPAPTAPAPRAG
jgi:uncharacterized membrane protein